MVEREAKFENGYCGGRGGGNDADEC